MSTFQWTTPTRRVGSRFLSPIPHEVYLEIFKYLDQSEELDATHCKRTFSALARVCRFFCAISISRIYRTLEFSGAHPNRAYSNFCQLLLTQNDSDPDVRFAANIAGFVEECVFTDWMSGRGQEWTNEFLDQNAKAMRLMPNIASLRLESTPITKSLLFTISKLKTTLKTVSIHSCPLQAELTKPQRRDLDSLRLHTVEFFGTSALSPDTLRLRDVEVFRTDSWEYGAYFLKRQHPSLRILELHEVKDLHMVFKYLEKWPPPPSDPCPLEELIITDIHLQLGADIPILTPAALPNIHTIHIPPSFLPSFSHRRLRKVVLLGSDARDVPGNHGPEIIDPALPYLTAKDMAPLMQSADSLTELHIPQHVYFAFDVCKNLKHLEVLVLAYAHPNYPMIPVISRTELFRDAIHALCTKWGPSSSLRELRLDFGADAGVDARPFMWDLQLQHQQLTGPLISTAFPQLTTAQIAARFVIWQRWDTFGTSWRPFVPHRFREIVRDALARGRPYTDVGGCLEVFDYK
ncbi:hypothetical protein C8F04DRAFT_1394433 [Mycena alexandri]|uniref:F-box domain-containing protein n=1 Tax=Mycena alexandri TaxID=1745969 RepID=A0AAD6T185_9AGAR|nr:hypothetical protein C8F04DRAFT_1394433 [Mycena alexandri]